MDIKIEKNKWYIVFYTHGTYIMRASMYEKNSSKSFTSDVHIDINNLHRIYRQDNTCISHNSIRLATKGEMLGYLPKDLIPYTTHELWI
jgi:hypothetical protein